MKEEGSGGRGELGSDLELDPDPWKLLWIRIQIRQNDADPLEPDPDPQHWFKVSSNFFHLSSLWQNFTKCAKYLFSIFLIFFSC